MDKKIIEKAWPQWQVRKKLGTGAFGEVYEAVHAKFNVEDRSAIKVIPIPSNPDEIEEVRAEGRNNAEIHRYFRGIVAEFVKEIQLMISLDGNSNIVSVKDYDVVEKEGEIGWYVLIRMELLTPYDRYVQEHPLSEKDVIKLGCDICNALEMCAKQKIIHRDIKPANIMIHEGTGYFKLGDFGVARKLESTTNGMTVAGARNYMAPEIIHEQKYDHRVDIYSLGLVLYRAMNRNRMPFVPVTGPTTHEDAVTAVQRRISGEVLPPPCDASQELAKVILRACAYDPEKRFASATEMRRALEQIGCGKREGARVVTENPDGGQTVRVRRTPEKPQSGAQNGTIRVRRAPKTVPAVNSANTKAATYGAKKDRRSNWKMIDAILAAVLALEMIVFIACGGPRTISTLVQVCVGTCYYHGTIVEQDYEKAAKWYRKAAVQGDMMAQNDLGNCYYHGNGVKQDYAEAVKWYTRAAEQGYSYAQNNLGNCYYHGNGVKQDYAEAVKWYTKAAEQGYSYAQNNLGNCYYTGKGTEQSYPEAVNWYQKAAEQGCAEAQYNLGWCYEQGKGVEQNRNEAVRWYRKAADQGSEEARKALETISAVL